MQLPKIVVQPQSLAAILTSMKTGDLQIPRFQREFVWPISKTRALLDSMYKEFPIGTFFLWKAPDGIPPLSRPLKELGIPGPQPGARVSYILDGQQRLTSLYCVVNGIDIDSKEYGKICINLEAATEFDANKEEDFNKDIFVYRSSDNKQYIAVKDLTGMNALSLYDGVPPQWKPAFNKAYTLFQTYPFSVVFIQEQTLADAIVIFQRINQAGQRLSRYDLVCANVWRDDFDFRKHVSEANKFFDQHGFGELDETIFTQTFALVLHDACSTVAELSLQTDEVKKAWKDVIRALGLAVDFVVNNLGVKKAAFLPYRGQLVVLAYFFYHRGTGAISANEREMLWDWFWRVTLSERYSSTSPTRMAEDARKMRGFLEGELPRFNYPLTATVDEVLRTKMSSTTSALRNGVLCMLALKQPRNFKDNSPVNLSDSFFSDLKQPERHHIFPVGYLKAHSINPNQVNLLANFCFIPSDLNKEIGARAPHEYLQQYKTENPNFDSAVQSHLIPIDKDSVVWKKDPSAFAVFLQERAKLLADELAKLVNDGPIGNLPAADPGTVEPHSDVDILEVQIRDFIDARLTAVAGINYWKKTMPGDVVVFVKERITSHLSHHPYLDALEYNSGRARLDFCDVSHYDKIIMKNWDVFGEVFQRKDDFQTHMNAFRNLRNCIQHNRKPTQVEQKNGEAAILWIRGALDKFDASSSSIDLENGDTDL